MKKTRKTVRVAASAKPNPEAAVKRAEELKERKLTWKEETFILHYIRTGNGTTSAMEAGYACPRQQGSDTLAKPASIADEVPLPVRM